MAESPPTKLKGNGGSTETTQFMALCCNLSLERTSWLQHGQNNLTYKVTLHLTQACYSSTSAHAQSSLEHRTRLKTGRIAVRMWPQPQSGVGECAMSGSVGVGGADSSNASGRKHIGCENESLSLSLRTEMLDGPDKGEVCCDRDGCVGREGELELIRFGL